MVIKMSKPIATVEQLHKPRNSAVPHLASQETISCEDLADLSAIQLYSVVIEHWKKCSPSAKEALMLSSNPAIRTSATHMACCQEVKTKIAVGQK